MNIRQVINEFRLSQKSGNYGVKITGCISVVPHCGRLYVVPEDAPTTEINIVTDALFAKGMSPMNEFNWLQALGMQKSELYAVPEGFGYGVDPDWIQTRAVCTPYVWGEAYDDKELAQIGRALGEFTGRVFDQFGAVHPALYPSSIGKTSYGKIMIDNIKTLTSGKPIEMAFLAPLQNANFNIFPAMAAEIKEVTGMPIDTDVLKTLIKTYLEKGLGIPEGMTVVNSVNSNLGPWLSEVYDTQIKAFRPNRFASQAERKAFMR